MNIQLKNSIKLNEKSVNKLRSVFEDIYEIVMNFNHIYNLIGSESNSRDLK